MNENKSLKNDIDAIMKQHQDCISQYEQIINNLDKEHKTQTNDLKKEKRALEE